MILGALHIIEVFIGKSNRLPEKYCFFFCFFFVASWFYFRFFFIFLGKKTFQKWSVTGFQLRLCVCFRSGVIFNI